ncbi:ATP-dependent DNA ligase [Rhodococcus sp. USK13]|uniref:ATP-dependent DNA ligase n=1 Tax=Rhodococcus sp. USK13 TaxID=2806442 RepID=UPI001BCC7B71|nr:ATP-dependent DNA ligase [Rhodococcus sp. USK13]
MANTGTRQVTVDGHRLSLTNLDKVLYPESGTTKREVIEYYTRIAPAMIPHILDRAATRKRWPNGVESDPFFEKNLAASAPAWLERRALEHSDRSVHYPILNSVAALAWAGQQAALEIHVPQWRFDGSRRGPATRIVFDLDPGPGVGLPECAEVARAVRDLVAELGWTAFPVTSGSKGIHLYVPLDRKLEGSGASTVAKQVATGLEKLMPELVTATMAKAVRAGKVFVDWSQNNPSKTTIAPYSLRGRPQPLVAAPRSWDELDDPELRQLSFTEVLERWETDGDLLADLDPPWENEATLADYRRKRDPSRTPEPMPDKVNPGAGNSFVIQEHHARRLHYDLRLEREGVLVSWAVPKNVPTSTGENRLAVHTEDHPLEYLTFSGTIPKGEYGGGTMTIWDTGTYDVEKWRDDEVIVQLHGEQVEGRFALIRTKGDQWLMHLMKDQSTGESTSAELPRDLSPMLATPGTLDGLDPAEWAFEGKWDGIRVIAEIGGGELRLRSRAGNDKTRDYPGLGWLADALADHDVVLDGEVVAFDRHGITSFGLLQQGNEPHFLAFDVLYLDGVSLLRKKYTDRRRVLEALAEKVDDLVVPPQLHGTAEEALEESGRRGWEGVVAKRRESVYLPGKRGSSWIKVKNWRTQEAVIGGWRRGQGGRSRGIGSILLGIPQDGGLRYVGRVGTGFTQRDLDELASTLGPLETETSPFVDDLPTADRKGAVWVKPTLVGEVRFMEWTGAGRLRHPSWRGLREDKRPADVVDES